MRITKNRVIIRRLVDSLSINVSLDNKEELCIEAAKELIKVLEEEISFRKFS